MPDSRLSSRHALLLAIALIWLAGNGLRLTILAVPPVIAMIRDEFALSATQVGLLSSIPQVLFALAALAGSLLVARLGIRGALVGGLAVVTAGSALRGFSPSFGALLAATVLMSVGVAIMQPIMPTAVRRWMPGHIGLGTAIYTNGLLVGEIFPTLLTIPWVLPAVDGSWRMALVFWSAPIAIIAVVLHLCAPGSGTAQAAAHATPHKWLPDWRNPLLWRLGALFCCINAVYFSSNAFLPIYLASAGRADLIGDSLLALNLGQLPASVLLLAVAGRIELRAWPYAAIGALMVVAFAGLVLDVGTATIWWSALLGFAVAAVLIVALTLAPLLCPPDDVARTAAGMFTISYTGSVAIALACGATWDLTGVPALAFLPLVVCAVAMVGVSVWMRANGELR